MANKRKIHKRKLKSTWYRAPTLAYFASDRDLSRQTEQYLTWLATTRGWFTQIAPCRHCSGSGRTQTGSSRRRKLVDCRYCDGTGKIAVTPRPDTDRARDYTAKQQAELDAIAYKATEIVRERLRALGLRPVVWRRHSALPLTLADYDAHEAERARMTAQFEAMRAAFDAETARIEALFQNGTDYNDLPERPSYHPLDVARGELARFGTPDESRWYTPGTTATIHVGTRTHHRYHDAVKPVHEIIIQPGLSPSSTEIDVLIEEAMTALAQPQLLAA